MLDWLGFEAALSRSRLLINTAFPNPLAVVVSSPAGDPVAGGLVTLTATSSGASAVLTGSPAQIAADGHAPTSTAVANGIIGSYKVRATAKGAGPATFSLTNSVLSGLTAVTVNHEIRGASRSSLCRPAGGTLLPAGRTRPTYTVAGHQPVRDQTQSKHAVDQI